MPKRLEGKVAVVTGSGATVGIGREVALAMASEGAKVVVNDIIKDPDGSWGADRVVKDIQKAGGTAVANYDSVASMEGGKKIINTAIANFGRVDILVNTAGNYKIKPTIEVTEEEWDSVINVHLKGAFACTHAAIQEMIKQKSGGRIVNFISIAAYTPGLGPGPSASYCAAKAGVMGFTKLIAEEFREQGITANSISPGATTTLFPFNKNGPSPSLVAPMVVYLATDEARDVTGQIFRVKAGDIICFAPPMEEPGPHQYLHKMGKWTVDELSDVIPRIVRKQTAL
jgi:NAD(P)-dependent dehydrogenase (short-subunit alcohol dehydrogenase family)